MCVDPNPIPTRDSHTAVIPCASLRPPTGRTRKGTVAALTILSHNETASELSLQQHLDIAPDLEAYNNLPSEGDSEPSMMAQPVPHQATDKKRVKVYELRNNDWFDRGTGFCMATLSQVSFLVLPLSRVSHVAHQSQYYETDFFFSPTTIDCRRPQGTQSHRRV